MKVKRAPLPKIGRPLGPKKVPTMTRPTVSLRKQARAYARRYELPSIPAALLDAASKTFDREGISA